MASSEIEMSDTHQANAIVASAICDCGRDMDLSVSPEQAKVMAKRIVSALRDAKLEIQLRGEPTSR